MFLGQNNREMEVFIFEKHLFFLEGSKRSMCWLFEAVEKGTFEDYGVLQEILSVDYTDDQQLPLPSKDNRDHM